MLRRAPSPYYSCHMGKKAPTASEGDVGVSVQNAIADALWSVWSVPQRRADEALVQVRRLQAPALDLLASLRRFFFEERDELLQLAPGGITAGLRPAPDPAPSEAELAELVLVLALVEHGLDAAIYLPYSLRMNRLAELAAEGGVTSTLLQRVLRWWPQLRSVDIGPGA